MNRLSTLTRKCTTMSASSCSCRIATSSKVDVCSTFDLPLSLVDSSTSSLSFRFCWCLLNSRQKNNISIRISCIQPNKCNSVRSSVSLAVSLYIARNFTNFVQYPLSSYKAYQESSPIFLRNLSIFIVTCGCCTLPFQSPNCVGSYRYLYKRLSSFLHLYSPRMRRIPIHEQYCLSGRKLQICLIYIQIQIHCVLHNLHKTFHSTNSYLSFLVRHSVVNLAIFLTYQWTMFLHLKSIECGNLFAGLFTHDGRISWNLLVFCTQLKNLSSILSL